MANGIFFVSWELWQQMTFVLAGAIVIVFCMGLIKLSWNNRKMRKHEIIDEEKRARLSEMRRVGLAVRRGNDIPFGVRAIQSGIEVDGIWISRPATPIHDQNAKLASSATLVGVDTNSEKKGKFVEDTRLPTMSSGQLGRAASDGTISQRLNDNESLNSAESTSPPQSQFASQSRRQQPRAAPFLSEDTLRKLETHAQSKPVFETYIPTSGPRNPRRPSHRSSVSSSGGESMDSQPQTTRSPSRRSYSSTRSSRLYTARHNYESRLNHSTLPPDSPEKESVDPFDTPARTPSALSAFSQDASDHQSPFMQSHGLPVPEPTFGPGDMHVNRTSRRVNAGFEVLPAGTFSTPQVVSANDSRSDLESIGEASRGYQRTNKLRKKSISQLPRGSPTF